MREESIDLTVDIAAVNITTYGRPYWFKNGFYSERRCFFHSL